MSRKDMLGGLVERLVKVSDEMLGMLDDLLTKTLNPEWFSEFKKFLRKEPCWTTIAEVVEKVKETARYLTRTLFSGVPLVATTGHEVEMAEQVFDGYCDPRFKKAGADHPTETCAVDVYEMTADGKYRQIFDGFGHPLDILVETRSQITVFCRDSCNKLRKQGYGTFFLYEEGYEFFVADVSIDDNGRLKVDVDPFSYDFVWSAKFRHRIVVPQLVA